MKYILILTLAAFLTGCRTNNNQDTDFGNIYTDSHQTIVFPVHEYHFKN